MGYVIRFARLEGNISCILNSVCINSYITYHEMIFFLRILFYNLSNDVNILRHYVIHTRRARRDSVLKETFPPGNYKLYFLQKLLKIASERLYFILSCSDLQFQAQYSEKYHTYPKFWTPLLNIEQVHFT